MVGAQLPIEVEGAFAAQNTQGNIETDGSPAVTAGAVERKALAWAALGSSAAVLYLHSWKMGQIQVEYPLLLERTSP